MSSPAPAQDSTQLFSVNGLPRKNTEGSRTLSRDSSTSKETDFRWVGSLVSSDWVEEREFSTSKNGENLLVGDLVVVMRSDGSMRFGEILTLNSASVCQVIVGKSSDGMWLVKEALVLNLYRPR